MCINLVYSRCIVHSTTIKCETSKKTSKLWSKLQKTTKSSRINSCQRIYWSAATKKSWKTSFLTWNIWTTQPFKRLKIRLPSQLVTTKITGGVVQEVVSTEILMTGSEKKTWEITSSKRWRSKNSTKDRWNMAKIGLRGGKASHKVMAIRSWLLKPKVALKSLFNMKKLRRLTTHLMRLMIQT